jgi:hypothetical protein
MVWFYISADVSADVFNMGVISACPALSRSRPLWSLDIRP